MENDLLKMDDLERLTIIKKLFNMMIYATVEESAVAKQKIIEYLDRNNLHLNDLYICTKNEIKQLNGIIKFLYNQLEQYEGENDIVEVTSSKTIRQENFEKWNYIADIWLKYKDDNPREGKHLTADGFRFGWYKEVIDFINYPFYGRVSSWNKKKALTRMPDQIINDFKRKINEI